MKGKKVKVLHSS